MRACLVAGLFLLMIGAAAAESGNISVQVGVTNSPPSVYTMYPAPGNGTITPLQASTVTAYYEFEASDPNGNADLNTTTAACSVTRLTTTRYSGSCAKSVLDAASAKFTCPIVMFYYDTPGLYSAHCQIIDMSAAGASRDANDTLVYNTLTAMALDRSSIDFGNMAVGATSGATNDPVIVYNQGNVAIYNVSMKAYDLNAGSNILLASNFNVTASDVGGTGAAMVNNTYKQVPTVYVNAGSGEYDNVFFWLRIPPSQPVGSYSTSLDWILAVNP